MSGQLLKVSDLAKLLGVGEQTARRRIDAGEIEWINVGKQGARRPRIRVSPAAVEAYLRTRKETATARGA